MALTDNAVLIAGTGAVWTGTVGVATKPTLSQLNTYASAGTVPSGWTSIGHTSLEDLPTPAQEDGETTNKGSWQNAQLTTSIETQPTDSVDIKSLQILDDRVLEFYHGGGDYTTNANEFAWPDTAAPIEVAVTFVYCHSATRVLGLYVPKSSVYRGDSMEFSNTEFATVPLKFTLLKLNGAKKAFWIADALGSAAA